MPSTTVDTGRLRRLDGLFADRVLGLRVGFSPREDYWWCEVGIGPHDMQPSVDRSLPLPTYTRSIYAAWEWAEKMGFVSIEGNPSDHPAEALVLACLKASGCTEEDLA